MEKWKELVFITVISVGCKKPYNPPAINASASYLVVEGVINAGADSTFIKLSHTVNLSSKVIANPELHALLTIESDQNTSYPLTEAAKGTYVSAGLNLDNSRKYRLRIKTANNEQYLSDFVPVVNAPAIDTVSYSIKSNGLGLYVSTHDPKNSTRYYRWDYQETWVFHSNFLSGYVSNGDTVIERNFNTNEIYQCWGNDTSSTVVIGSSAKLATDVISNQPVTFVNSTSEKLGSKYSIIVRQYALTSDAFKFWTNLKTITEQLGSIFDAQPTQINGNIHSVTNPSEPVIGYVSAGSTSSKRIFITNQQLPAWATTLPYPDCKLDTLYLQFLPPGGVVEINQENEYFNYNKGAKYNTQLIPVGAIIIIPKIGPEIIIGHSGALPECVDCTLRGTNKQPAFWK
jgi:hypothetical protein